MVNPAGSFTCECTSAYVGDGLSCFETSTGLSTGAIVGIVLGMILFLLLLAGTWLSGMKGFKRGELQRYVCLFFGL